MRWRARAGGAASPGNYVRGHSGIPGNERVDAIADGLARGQQITFYQRSADRLHGARSSIMPDDTSVPKRSSASAGGRSSSSKAAAYSYLESGGRHGDASLHVGRLRTPRQRPLRRALQEGAQRSRRIGDPARLARHLRPISDRPKNRERILELRGYLGIGGAESQRAAATLAPAPRSSPD